jgi:hypothetical protein
LNEKICRVKSKTPEKIKSTYNRCITCNKACSMSGMCMKMWPEFVIAKQKKDKKNGKNGEKNS